MLYNRTNPTRDYRDVKIDYKPEPVLTQEEVNESCVTGLKMIVLFGQALLLCVFIGTIFLYGLPFLSIWMDK